MFRIGDFSRIGRVTIETLRHYDNLGLLKPARIDPNNGYRYYSASQLQILNRIIALKEVGLSLDQIGRILQDNPSPEEIRGMLKAQLAITESTIQEAEQQRNRILSRMDSLAIEEKQAPYEVILKSTPALSVAAIREKIPTVQQIPGRIGEMFNQIAIWMKAHQLPFGPPLTIYHDESYSEKDVDTECAFIIPGLEINALPIPDQPISIHQLPEIENAASTIVGNSFLQKPEGLKPAYSAILQWIEDHDYVIQASPREIYYGSIEKSDFTAEIQFPVIKCK